MLHEEAFQLVMIFILASKPQSALETTSYEKDITA
jgi:hypothetical protein